MPNEIAQAAAEGLPKFIRRHALMLFPAGLVAAGVTTATASAAAQLASPEERAAFHARELAKAMRDINPAKEWRATISHEHSFALVCGHDETAQVDSAPIYDGPDFYEVELTKSGRRPILWVTRERGHYKAAHCWNGRFETKPRRYTEGQMTLLRKVPGYSKRMEA